MSIVIDYIRLADVQSPIVLVSSLRILAAKHNELTSMYSLVMLILILILAYPNNFQMGNIFIADDFDFRNYSISFMHIYLLGRWQVSLSLEPIYSPLNNLKYLISLLLTFLTFITFFHLFPMKVAMVEC